MTDYIEVNRVGVRVPGDLDDERSILALIRHYADVADEGYDPDKLAALFTQDAVWRSTSENGTSDFGTHHGRAAIHAFFSGASKQMVHAHHIVMSPEVSILEPGRTAVGRWNTIVLMQLASDDHAVTFNDAKLMSAVYKHEYKCIDNTWQISNLHVHTLFDLRIPRVG